MLLYEEEKGIMKYRKPAILNSNVIRAAVCGGGSPCGRPCSKKA